MKYLHDIDLKNKRVLVRVDYNVPLKNGKILDDARIKMTFPTIEYILKQPRSKIALLSHFGRPKGKAMSEFSLKPICEKLSEILKRDVRFVDDPRNPAGEEIIRNLTEGQIALCENIRFYPEEEANDEKFAIDICHHFGVFVNDAFSASHRAHASIFQIPRFKPSCAGFLFQKEIEELSKALNPPRRPALAVIGGAKIETKLPTIENLSRSYDVVLVGGKVGAEALKRNYKFPKNVILPEDFSEGNFDIGPKTIEKYKNALLAAAFIVWNGPMGKFEEALYRKGTEAVYEAIKNADAYKIAGGGETVEYIDLQKGSSNFNFLSSGGGAMLEFLSGKILPGVKALEDNL